MSDACPAAAPWQGRADARKKRKRYKFRNCRGANHCPSGLRAPSSSRFSCNIFWTTHFPLCASSSCPSFGNHRRAAAGYDFLLSPVEMGNRYTALQSGITPRTPQHTRPKTTSEGDERAEIDGCRDSRAYSVAQRWRSVRQVSTSGGRVRSTRPSRRARARAPPHWR